MNRILKCRIRGLVQGVFFRDSTRRRAETLGLDGHAINLSDGSVEVVVSGESKSVESLRQWLEEGPPHASVDSVSCEELDIEVSPGFRID